mmetsp:Transcript_145/g.274  ORF Transcript_145/g.274 Transcript_145/m.274 type:complete len:206 (+) Transcript_145:183-800(+)
MPFWQDPLWEAVDLLAILQPAVVERIVPIVVFDMLICCQILQGYDCVVDGKQQNCQHQEEAIKDKDDKLRLLPDCHCQVYQVPVFSSVFIHLLAKDNAHSIDAPRQEECGAVDQNHKVAVVVQPHTVPKPRAVVVETKNAIVTEGAVFGARGSEDVASAAELLLHSDVTDAQEAMAGLATEVQVLLHLLRYGVIPWDDPRVGEGC